MIQPADNPSPIQSVNLTAGGIGPFVYFDGATTVAVDHTGTIVQIGLGAHVSLVEPDGSITTRNVITANLRCSIEAAKELRRALDSALLLAAKTDGQTQ